MLGNVSQTPTGWDFRAGSHWGKVEALPPILASEQCGNTHSVSVIHTLLLSVITPQNDKSYTKHLPDVAEK